MKNKEVEWEDTSFPFSVDYNYPLAVKNRCVLFWGISKNWKKTLNFASKFCKPNKICISYIYGTEKINIATAKKYVEDLPKNLIVFIFSDITVSEMDALKSYQELLKKYKTAGLANDEGLSDYAQKERNQIYHLFEKGRIDESDGSYRRYKEFDRIEENYRYALKTLNEKQYGQASILSNFTNIVQSRADGESLLGIIRQLFPLGVESDSSDEESVKITKARKYIKSALEGKTDAMGITLREETLQLNFFDDYTEGASEIFQTVKGGAERSIREEGSFSVCSLWEKIKQPPFGAYECNWYLFLFAYALRTFLISSKYRILVQYSTTPILSVDPVYCVYEKVGRIFEVSNSQRELNTLIRKLFDIKKKTEDVNQTLLYARNWCEKNVRTPLDFVDHRLYEILDFDPNKWTYRKTSDLYLDWLRNNFDEIYKKIRSVDEDFDNEMGVLYGQHRVALFRKHAYVKNGAVGWLHLSEDFKERIENYMKQDICRECGRPLELFPGNKISYEDTYIEENDGSNIQRKYKKITFSVKDCIGLNKKFLGRYQNEYFCIPCLCEVLDTDAVSLYQKIHEFKEQGCTLFL